MLIPSIHVSVSGSVISIYAAIVATVTGAVQLSNYLRDRARIRLRVQHNMEIIGGLAKEKEEGLTIVYVMNAGRRPATITTVGAQRLYPHHPFIIVRCNPPLPYELTEGKTLHAIIPKSNLDFKTIDYWEAYDAVGGTYRLRVAPRYWHVISGVKSRIYLFKQRRRKSKN